jgi:hypothetical protein
MRTDFYIIGYGELREFDEYMRALGLAYSYRDEDEGRYVINPDTETAKAIEKWQAGNMKN